MSDSETLPVCACGQKNICDCEYATKEDLIAQIPPVRMSPDGWNNICDTCGDEWAPTAAPRCVPCANLWNRIDAIDAGLHIPSEFPEEDVDITAELGSY